MATYLEDMEVNVPLPSIRLTASVLQEEDEIVKTSQVLKEILLQM